MSKQLTIALIQMDVELGKVEANCQKALEMIEEASKLGAQVVCLPELWTTGYDLKNIEHLAICGHDSSLDLLTRTAEKLKLDIFAGSLAEMDGNNIYNTAYYINSKGTIVNKYRKIHLFRLMNEEKYLTPGDKVEVFETDFFMAGAMICYDLRFPEIARKLSLAGATALFIPAEFPEPRKRHWQLLNMARAIENQAYVFAINRVGKDDNSKFFGASMIIDPWGDVIAEGGANEEIVIAEINLDLVRKVRNTLPALRDRKPEYY